MSKQGIPYRIKLSAIFVSLTILVIGVTSLAESMAIDYYSVLNTLMKIAPASVIMGVLGWVMGMILDQPKRRSGRGYNNSFVSSMMKSSLADATGDDSTDESS